jgi:hypothetical protein
VAIALDSTGAVPAAAAASAAAPAASAPAFVVSVAEPAVAPSSTLAAPAKAAAAALGLSPPAATRPALSPLVPGDPKETKERWAQMNALPAAAPPGAVGLRPSLSVPSASALQ